MADSWRSQAVPPGSLPDKSSRVVAAAICAIFFSTAAVILRCCSRRLSRAGFWWDDWVIIASLPFTWALVGCDLGWVSVGLGKHVWSPGVQPATGMKFLLASECVYDTSITLIRLSVLLFYHRIFGTDRGFKLSLWVSAGILVAWFLAITILAIFQCNPVAKQWNFTLPGHCYSLFGTFLGVTIPNIFLDLLLLLLPLPKLWKLQLQLKKKIALIFNFMLGYCVIIVTIFRLLSIIRVPADAVDDVTWNSTNSAILFMIEPAVATVSICLPSVWSLCVFGFKRFPTEYIRGRWSNQKNRRSRTSSLTPVTACPEKVRTRQNTSSNKEPWIRIDGASGTISPVSPIDEEAPNSFHSTKPSNSEELEERVRGFYTHRGFGGRSQDTLQRGRWDEDLEKGHSSLHGNPIPVPPKPNYEVLVS